MENEIKEIIAAEPKKAKKKELNPMDYVTIPVKEYRKMVQKVERMKARGEALAAINNAKQEALAGINAAESDRDQYRRWWHEEQSKTKKLEEALAEAKKQLKELLGVEETNDEQG